MGLGLYRDIIINRRLMKFHNGIVHILGLKDALW